MPFLSVCRTIAGSTPLLWCVSAALVAAFAIHSAIAAPLDAYEDGLNLPDARMLGYTPDELNQWYNSIGIEGCKIYIQSAHWDFMPIMVIYPVFLGSMILVLGQEAGLSENLVYVPLSSAIFDIIETYLQREGCVIFPERLPDQTIRIASLACQTKWLFLITSILTVVGLFLKGKLSTTAASNAEHKRD
ncbi:expressed unknown protein [Seminavis robusta]|uniref:Uncharacterized protein n=1 Tax=Seminavis robusta TaxID=568900 RepID=A0A9N8H2P5_9STRA|nr:expressed unknown protein [Seminavis robusta]|eukprot:Sro12_g009490.1 n/a (189) ;mRNA; r:135794-136360